MMFVAVFALMACEMDLYRSDTMTSANFKTNPGAAVYSTDGNYAMFKEELDLGVNDRGGFSRIYFLMSELRGDNAYQSESTTDPLAKNNMWTDVDIDEDLTYMWTVCYKIIYGCNTNIESMLEGQSSDIDHLIGENYFLRAVAHLSLCNLFATPYSRGAEKNGVIIRTSTDCSKTERATVGQVYDQIVSDLQKAMTLMKGGDRRGNAGYASYDAAAGLLTRVYLYMEENDKVIELANEMLGTTPIDRLDPDYSTYFARAKDSDETLWCIAKTVNEPSFVGSDQGQLASMYYKYRPEDPGNDVPCWCQIYWSDPLMDLLLRYPEDERTSHLIYYGLKNDGKKIVYWPDPNSGKARSKIIVYDVDFDENATECSITREGKSYKVKKTTVDGYPAYYIEGMYTDAVDQDDIENGTRCYVRGNIDFKTGVYAGFPMYGMSKFSFQNGKSALSSPVMIRWAEVILNRAEANAKLGNDQAALDDVNVIRTRAGLSGDALWTLTNFEGKYDSVLDIVLDERRLELCFEGHRAIDVYRNGRNLDRRAGGIHTYEIITPEQMDIRYPYCIPYSETSVSGIPKNGRQ